MVAPYMRQLGYDSQLVIANDPYAQAQWLVEHPQVEVVADDWISEIVRAQIDLLKPDVLYLTEPLALDSKFLRTLSHKPDLVLGWRASDIPRDTDWSEFDVILSALSGIRSAALQLGARASEHFMPGFPDWIYAAVEDVEPERDVVFCGQWTRAQHGGRNALLDEIARGSDSAGRFDCALHLSGEIETLTGAVASRNLGPRYGMEMYRALRSGRIAFDARVDRMCLQRVAHGDPVDLAGDQTANMRIFEATGCGRLLLTEHRENLADLFELGREIETFRSPAELHDKIRYYLRHPEEREDIAQRGRERCHREHSMDVCVRDLDSLIRNHLERKRLIEVRAAEPAETVPGAARERQPHAFRELESRPSGHTHGEHLQACMDWLARASTIWPGGGVAAIYHPLEGRWDSDDPETTACSIPSFLQYHLLTGDERYLHSAREMADWELSMQTPEGDVREPVGVCGGRPRIFSTGQVVLGWVAMYERTGDLRYLQAAERAGHWLAKGQDPDGKWSNTDGGPRSYHVRTAWALLELFEAAEDETFRAAAERSFCWVLCRAEENGWFRENSLSDPERPGTRQIGHTLAGLAKICAHHAHSIDVERAQVAAFGAAELSRQAYLERRRRGQGDRYVGLPGTLDRYWNSAEAWSCLAGDAQMAFYWELLGRHGGDAALITAARTLVEELKLVHLIDADDADVRGGLLGSHPSREGEGANTIPSWGAKFFADCLMQRLFEPKRLRYLG